MPFDMVADKSKGTSATTAMTSSIRSLQHISWLRSMISYVPATCMSLWILSIDEVKNHNFVCQSLRLELYIISADRKIIAKTRRSDLELLMNRILIEIVLEIVLVLSSRQPSFQSEGMSVKERTANSMITVICIPWSWPSLLFCSPPLTLRT
jgi:hypothetical protein